MLLFLLSIRPFVFIFWRIEFFNSKVMFDVLCCLKAESSSRQLVASFHMPDKRISTFS
jgi:hypothetical protein